MHQSKNKRALITGLNGFTGRYLESELKQAGYDVFGLGESPSMSTNYTQVDIANVAELRCVVAQIDPHVVFHLAGIAFVGNSSAEAFYKVNTIGTRNLLESLSGESKSLECVLLASSANVYGNSIGGVLSESTPANPANDYAVSKLAMEYMARLWFDKLPIVIARPFNYTGVGQTETFLLPKIVNHFKRRAREIELGNCDVFRDFSDVRAVVSAYRKLVVVGPVGQIVNICSSQTHSVNQVLEMMGELAGYEISVKVNPAFVRANEVHTLLGSSDKLKALIGQWNTPPLSHTLSWMFHADDGTSESTTLK